MDQENTQNYIVKAIDLTHDALGVARLPDGYTVFVENLLKGETASIEVIERRKKFGFGKVIELLQKSPYRLAPKCKHFDECGGCRLMHMDYDVQLAFKRYRLELMMKKLNQDVSLVDDIICMVNPYFYRNKVTTETELRALVFKYIETWYNNKRIHSSLDYMSPREYKLKQQLAA